jgi:hypothetical protein
MAVRAKVDLQIRGLPAALRQRITSDEWLSEIAKYPPAPGLRPGDGTKVIRAMRDVLDRA